MQLPTQSSQVLAGAWLLHSNAFTGAGERMRASTEKGPHEASGETELNKPCRPLMDNGLVKW